MKEVPDFYMIKNTDSLYPKIIKFPYVKVGQKMPSYGVGVVSAEGGADSLDRCPRGSK